MKFSGDSIFLGKRGETPLTTILNLQISFSCFGQPVQADQDYII